MKTDRLKAGKPPLRRLPPLQPLSPLRCQASLRVVVPFLVAYCFAPSGQAASDWVVVDPDMPARKADRSSLERKGPWVEFTDVWGAIEHGLPAKGATIEREAVNCLTGAFGAVQYPSHDEESNRPIQKTQTLSEIEHAQSESVRMQPEHNGSVSIDHLMTMACTCPSGEQVFAPSEAEIRRIYDQDMAEQMQKVEYHLNFLRVDSRQTALEAIAALEAGHRFEDVFDRYANASDAHTFVHGDLGPHLETEWPIEDVRRYRQMAIGEFTTTPHKGIYGWEVEKLVAKRVIPAPPLEEMRSRIVIYLRRAHSCGWTP